MRWDTLFADLEAQLQAAEGAALDAEVAERVRIEVGALTLTDRLRGHIGSPVTLRLVGATVIRGRIVEVGADMCLIADDSGARVIVAVRGVVMIGGLRRAARTEVSAVLRRLGLRHALRALARERQQVRMLTVAGEVSGTIDRVGADHIDLTPRVPGDVGEAAAGHVIALEAVVAVWSS